MCVSECVHIQYGKQTTCRDLFKVTYIPQFIALSKRLFWIFSARINQSACVKTWQCCVLHVIGYNGAVVCWLAYKLGVLASNPSHCDQYGATSSRALNPSKHNKNLISSNGGVECGRKECQPHCPYFNKNYFNLTYIDPKLC